MSDELQSDGAAAAIKTEAAPVENQNTGSDLATDSGGEHEKTPQVDEAAVKQAAIDRVINEKHFQAKQAERERDALQERLDKLERENREAEAARVGQIPPIPDSLDDDFDEKMRQRDMAIQQKANFDASQANLVQQQQNQQAVTQAAADAASQQAQVAYSAKALELGIDATEMNAAVNAVMSFGITGEAAQFLLADPDGPLLTKHLAANPGDVMSLNGMSVVQQGAFLSSLKAKAEALRPRQTQAPDPVDHIAGNGAVKTDTDKYPNSGRAKFS